MDGCMSSAAQVSHVSLCHLLNTIFAAKHRGARSIGKWHVALAYTWNIDPITIYCSHLNHCNMKGIVDLKCSVTGKVVHTSTESGDSE